VELTAETAERYLRHAFDQMLDVADRLGDDKVNRRPPGPDTNTVAGLIIHSCGVATFWLGHVGLGQPTERVREDEFSATATVAELHTLVDETLGAISKDLQALEGGERAPEPSGRVFLLDADESDGSLVVHVLEEAYQHLGHMELTADALSD